MRLFDTDVQKLKYEILREVVRHAYEDRLTDCYLNIPKIIAPGPKATMRCCIYKERAIVAERVKLAMGGNPEDPNIVEVIGMACDECTASGYLVGPDCRGCIAHRCIVICPKDAITLDGQRRAHIDASKCIGCGKCAAVCPYSAIHNHTRPCEKACKIKAITSDPNGVAHIHEGKCTGCGACVYQCPFGAISDKSYLLDAIRMILDSNNNTNYKVYAVIAPSISSQFQYAKLGQVIFGLKKLGFYNVVEAALGADMVAYHEAQELAEKKFLISSCCPAFVDHIHKNFPELVSSISANLSPMAEISRRLKENDPTAKIVFLGPCTAKKLEIQQESVKPYVDCALTFEELQAWIDSRDFDVTKLPEEPLDNASLYGRIFARCGGLSDAVAQALKELNVDDFALSPVSCNGIEECHAALLKKKRNVLPANFIEGMACIGGCIGGAGCLTHGDRDKRVIDQYGATAKSTSISETIQRYEAEAGKAGIENKSR